MPKLPALQFYVGDWRKDPGVQSLSYHDRGVWFEMLCLMHESEQRGHLILNGKPMSEDQLSRLLGLDKQALTRTIHALYEAGVCSKCHTLGSLYCRRMVRDEDIRTKRKAAGKMGGNPDLINHSEQMLKQRGKELNHSSTKTQSEVIHRTKQNTEDEVEEIERTDHEKGFETFWRAYPEKSGKKPARIAYQKAIARLEKLLSAEEAEQKLLSAALDYSLFLKNHPSPPKAKYAQGWLNDERYEDDFALLPSKVTHDPRGNLALREQLERERTQNGV